jgi:hypothetical protein
MTRTRFASLLVLLCGMLLAWSLVGALDHLYPPPPYVLWCLCTILFLASVGLWFQIAWARITFLIAGVLLLLFEVATALLAPGGCAGTLVDCYGHYIHSEPSLAVGYYLARFTCSSESISCYTAFMYLQPVLLVMTAVVLIRPSASNNRWSGP